MSSDDAIDVVPEVIGDLFYGSERGRVDEIAANIAEALKAADDLNFAARIDLLNRIRNELHKLSPLKSEPVDLVQWVPADLVTANDYNPNAVAPPEMELLAHSIGEDGYTQPIVAWRREDGMYEVVDGFHRHRVGKENAVVRERISGYLPLVIVNQDRLGRGDRIAATIRHNRARGKHRIDGMSDIVVELKRRNWTDEKIQKELGMEPDEILRLTQISGLSDLFSDREFSKAWDVEGVVTEDDFMGLTDSVEEYMEEVDDYRYGNTDDPGRIFHTHDKWECYPAGFYATHVDGLSKGEGEELYRAFLSNRTRFAWALDGVLENWKHSCEHYLTNSAMNRIAWLGQAAACYDMGIPAVFRSGFHLLSEEEQDAADECALEYLNKWLRDNGREEVGMEEAKTGRQSDLY